MKRWEKFETAYVVLRLDGLHRDRIPDDPDVYVTAKEVYWTVEEAVSEVERLNHVNAEMDCLYWWQGVRVKRRDLAEPS
jgi:hypothetical protein